jgi:hypothetical protein
MSAKQQQRRAFWRGFGEGGLVAVAVGVVVAVLVLAYRAAP